MVHHPSRKDPMPINKSISELPLPERSEGRPPSRNAFVAEKLAEAWYARYLADGNDHLDRAIPEAGPYRGSYAGKRCDRALYYALAETPPSNPPTIADAWRFGTGSMVHEKLQAILPTLFEGAENEVDIDLRTIGVPGSSHADVVLTHEGQRTLVEVKSIGGFGFKTMATRFKGAPGGPRFGDVMQAALAAKAHGCTRVVIAYLSLENVGPDLVDYTDSEAGRFAAEWHFTVDQLEDWIAAEIGRIHNVIDDVEKGTPSERALHDPTEYPPGAVIVDPFGQRSRGTWHIGNDAYLEDTGTAWQCGYCWHRDKCKADGA
jgi:hypothetical protein